MKSKKNSSANTDLKDNARDQKRLEPDEANLNLPDVKDIPGQENIKPAPLGDLADDTISSGDEEGDEIFNEEEITEDRTEGDITPLERRLIDEAYDPESTEDEPVDQLTLDGKDNEGESLNEGSFEEDLFGEDLDTDLPEEEEEEDEGEKEEA